MPAPHDPPPFFYPGDLPPALPPAVVRAGIDPAVIQCVRDEENLRMLSISHYVLGGFAIFFSSIFLFHVFFGIVILSHPNFFAPPDRPPRLSAVPSSSPGPGDAPRANVTPGQDFNRRHLARHNDGPPAFLGYLMIGLGSCAVLIGWTIGGLIVYSGRCLAQRRHRTLSMVVGGISCLQIPFGTLLGIFTLTVLQRPSVKALYALPRVPIPPPANA